MSLIEEAREVRRRIAARLAELEPLVREYDELRRAAADLGLEESEEDVAPAPSSSSEADLPPASERHPEPARRSPRRRQGPRRPAASRAAGPPPNGGELGERVLQAVRERPGQSVADYAQMLDVSPAALYRPVRELTTSGEIVKRSRQLYPS